MTVKICYVAMKG